MEIIDIGCLIQIILKDGRICISQVDSIQNGKILIYPPKIYGLDTKLNLEEVYNFLFFTEIYLIKCDVLIIQQLPNLNYIVEFKSHKEKIQRRIFSRFSLVLPFNFYILNDFGYDYIKDSKLYIGIIKDISIGGIRFVTNENIPINFKIKCLLELESDALIVFGNIMEQRTFPKSNYKYQYRLKFDEDSTIYTSNTKDRISDFIKRRQFKA